LNLFHRGLEAIEAAAQQLADLDGRFLLPALLLQLTGLGLRAMVWRNVICAAYPDRCVPAARSSPPWSSSAWRRSRCRRSASIP
jgi:hypothetical protein